MTVSLITDLGDEELEAQVVELNGELEKLKAPINQQIDELRAEQFRRKTTKVVDTMDEAQREELLKQLLEMKKIGPQGIAPTSIVGTPGRK